MSLSPLTAAVLGLGRSGLAVARFLRAQGIAVTAYDQSEAARAAAQDLDIPLRPLSLDTVIREQVLFRSPGIRPDYPAILAACRRGARLSDEISLFAAHCPCPILAITGSDGKTTTATLTARALEMGGYRVHLGGNIGRSLLDELSGMHPTHMAVLELSSFQLMTADLRPSAGAITCLSPNHLNWHADTAEYYAAKRRLCDLSSRLVLRQGVFPDLPATRVSAREEADYCVKDGALCARGEHVLPLSEMRLSGLHNAENALTAIALTEPYLSAKSLAPLLREFSGVRHRMEWVARCRGVDCYDSSIDTSPARTLTTLCAFASRGIRPTLLLGGAEKGLPLTALVEALPHLASRVLLFGSADRLAEALTRARVPFLRFQNLESAVRAALSDAKDADTLLLSPAFTAFDAYTDYEARGEDFRRIVLDFAKNN